MSEARGRERSAREGGTGSLIGGEARIYPLLHTVVEGCVKVTLAVTATSR